jgi:hypothetical protein
LSRFFVLKAKHEVNRYDFKTTLRNHEQKRGFECSLERNLASWKPDPVRCALEASGMKISIKVLLATALVAVCGGVAYGFLGFGGTSWQEEVLLHDGGKIIIDRWVDRGGRHEVGQKAPYKQQRLSFTMPGNKQKIVWEDTFSKELRMANFLPMLLDIQNNIVYLVVNPMGCLSYNKWGRPNPPYVIFKYDGKRWQRIPLDELPAEIKTPNLILSMPDIVVEKSGGHFMSAERIKKIISSYPQPEYKTILREALDLKTMDCVEHIHTENHRWLSIDWFSDQPNYEACLKVCEREHVNPRQCPCDKIFNKNIKEK